MKTILSVFSLSLCCVMLTSGIAAAAPLAPPPINSTVNNPGALGAAVEVNLVNVEAYVTDANGKPVTDLRERDFEVREDGKRVSISHFAALAGSGAAGRNATLKAGRSETSSPEPVEPWNLIVTIDNFDLHPASRTRALNQVREFLSRQLAPGDRVMITSLDSGLRVWLPFSADRAAIDASLKQVEGLATQGPSIDRDRRHAYDNILSIQTNALSEPQPHACPQDIARPAHDFAAARRDEVFHTLGGLTVLVNSLSGVPGRKALLYVSDGLPATPGEEVFQFLAEICGGGSGTAGIGHQAVVGQPNTIENTDRSSDGGVHLRPDMSAANVNLDPMAVYDSRSLGPGAYKAASQAPLDAQSYNVGKQLEALVAHANAQRVTLYALQASGLAGPGAADADAGPSDRLTQFPSIETAVRTSNQNSLTALASGTGGRAILDVNDFGLDLARMQEDLTTYYSLGYTPSHSGDGKEHRIEVKLKRSGLRLRYRESYRDKPVMEKAVDRTLAALFYGVDDNPLKIELEVGDQIPGTGGNFTVPVRLRIPLFKVAILDGDENYEGTLRLLVATRGADGRMTPVRQIPVPIHIPRKEVLTALGQYYVYTLTLQMPPGEQRVAVGVRDDVAATSSYLSRAVTVGATASVTAEGH